MRLTQTIQLKSEQANARMQKLLQTIWTLAEGKKVMPAGYSFKLIAPH